MAVLDLGSVTFGLGADTKGLDRSIQKLHQFGQVIDRATRSQVEGANKAVDALARQEHAIRQNLQATLAMQQQLRSAGAQPQAIGAATVAFQKFTTGMTRTNLTLKDQLRLQGRFQASMGKSRRALRNLKTGRAAKGLGRMTEVMRDLESASVLAVGPLSGIGARIRALGAIANRSTLAVVGLLAGITGLVVVFTKLFASSVRARVQMDRIMGAMQQATGASVFARKEFEFVSEVADRMGQKVSVAAESYAQFAAAARDTKVEGEGVRIVFEGVLAAVTALKLPTETQTGLFRALIQMMSKGVIQSEELRGQFGERLAGGFEIVRKEIGKTRAEFAKMLKAGELISEKFIIPIGEAMQKTFGEQAVKSAKTFVSAVNRMDNAQFQFNLRLDELISTSGVATGAVNTLTSAIKLFGENLDTVFASIGAFTVGLLILFGPGVLKGLRLLGRGIRFVAVAMIGLNAAMLANPAAALISIFLRLGAAIIVAVGAFELFSALMDNSSKATQQLTDDIDELIKIDQLRTSLQVTQTQEIIELAEKRIRVLKIEAEAIRDVLKISPKGLQIFGFDIAGSEKLQGLDAAIDSLADKIVKIKALVGKGIKPLGEEGDISKVLQKAIDKVEDLDKVLSRSRQQIENLGKDVKLDPDFLEALFEAQDIIKELSEEDLVKLQGKLEDLGFSSENAAEGLTQLAFAAQQAEDKFKKMLKAFERSPKIVREINRDLDQMRRMIEALGQGSFAVEELNKQFEREDALEAYRQKLEKLTDEARKSILTLEEFGRVLEELEAGEEKLEEVIKPLEDAFKSAFDRIGDSIVEAFEKGSISLKSLGDLANAVFAEIFKAVLQLTILDPFKKMFSGSGFISGLVGIFTASAKGNAFENGMVKKFGKGGILSGPTIFPLAKGGIGIGGEAGTEAILPLARTSTGELGVKTTGQQQGTTIIHFNFPPGTDVREFNRSRGQMATIARGVAFAGSGNM